MKDNTSFKIVIFDGTFEMTSFIRRLVEGLVKTNEIYVLGFNEALKNKIAGVRYLPLGSNSSNLKLVQTSLKLLQHKFTLTNLSKTLALILKGDRNALQAQNLNIQLEKINPDVIHGQWVSVLPYLESYLINQQFPIVLSQRGYHTNVRPFIDRANFKYLSKWYPKLSAIHSVSAAMREKGKNIGEPYTGINEVVYTGLDLYRFNQRPLRSRPKSDQCNIASIGRPHWVKGYSDAFKAFSILKDEGFSFHYTIVGGDNDEELLFLRHYYNLTNEVTFTPKIAQKEVFKIIYESEILLLPSIEEGIANVVVEAMAIGTLVACSDCGGMRELIDHKVNGIIFPTRSPERMAAEIVDLCKLPKEEKLQMRKNARLKVNGQHNIQRTINEMLLLYNKIVDNHRKSKIND